MPYPAAMGRYIAAVSCAMCLQLLPVVRQEMYSQEAQTHGAHIYTTSVYTWLATRSQTDTQSTHTNTGNNDGLILLIPEQNQEVSRESIPTQTGSITPMAQLRHSVCLMDCPWVPVPQLLAFGCMSPPMQLLAKTTSLIPTTPWAGWVFSGPTATTTHGVTLRDTHKVGLAPRDPPNSGR